MILLVCLPLLGALNPATNCRLDFPFNSEAEKEALIALVSNKASGDALNVLDANNLVTRLGPYKCGFLRQMAGAPPSRRRTFTLSELGRHIYPQIGMYCAIDGDVFDLGREFGAALCSSREMWID